MKRALVLAVVAGWLATAACVREEPPVGRPIENAWEAPAPAAANPSASPTAAAPGARPEPSTAQTRPADNDLVAVVNGRGIARGELVDLLVSSHGLASLEQLIVLSAARQRGTEMGLNVTPADVAAAHQDALRRIASPVADPQAPPLQAAEAERLLDEFLGTRNLSRSQWELRMQQQAWLSKIARAEVERTAITEPMLREEYGLAYGERVQIRHIQLDSADTVRRVRERLTGGEDFGALAREYSRNALTAQRDGVVPPFTRHDGAVPPLIREAAFSLAEGKVSEPLRDAEGPWYHIIKVERKFPASGVGFENIDQDALRARLSQRLVDQRRTALEAELFQSARIDIRDPQLRRQFNQRHQR